MEILEKMLAVVEMKKYFFILFLGAILIFICSCHKDQPVPAPTSSNPYYLQKATLDYCYFKSGSWWLYQDSISGIKDSVYVTSSKDSYDTITPQDNLGYTGIFEYFFLMTSSSYLNFTQKVYLNTTFSQNSHLDHVQYYRNNSNYVGGVESYFETKLQNGYTIGNSPGYITSFGVYDSLKIGNVWYKNVAPFYNDHNCSEYNLKTYMYFSKNIGLIKKMIPDSSRNWILINYNVVQ